MLRKLALCCLVFVVPSFLSADPPTSAVPSVPAASAAVQSGPAFVVKAAVDAYLATVPPDK